MKSIVQSPESIQVAAQFADEELTSFLQPLWALYPDKRLQRTAVAMVKALITAQTPHISKAMRIGREGEATAWTLSKRGYRSIHTKRVTTWKLTKSLYRMAQRTVREEGAERLVVAIDPVQFEKPYARRIEGVSRVHKSRPPDVRGRPGLRGGIPPSRRQSSIFLGPPPPMPIGSPIRVSSLSPTRTGR